MLLQNQHPLNKSLVASVLGLPNVGKSSLINYLLGMDLSIVTAKPQTTRNKFHCVFTVDRTEIVLVDTPGLHRSGLEFNKRLNQQAREGLLGAELNLLLVDPAMELKAQLAKAASLLNAPLGRTWLVLTKADLVPDLPSWPWREIVEGAREIVPSIERSFAVSAKSELNMNLLTGALCDAAPGGPHLYPDGSISNKNERFFAAEYVREQAFQLLKDELPYHLAVVVDDYYSRSSEVYISMSILVNRPSQRAIVVGAKGSMIKRIGTVGRKKIEAMLGGKVHLKLHVKISPRWFGNHLILKDLGLPRAPDSVRAWRRSG